jgi:CRP-like cAMP-binding protein
VAAETLFVLLEGRVVVYRLSAAGRRLTLATLHAGEVFGEASLAAPGTYGAYAVAAEPCRVRAVPRADAVRLLVDDPQHARWLLERILRRLRVVEAQLAELAFKELPARLAGALLRLARRTGTGQDVAGYSHRELAEMLGAHRESVTLVLDLLQAEGTVAIERRRIHLRQPDRLRELAGAP